MKESIRLKDDSHSRTADRIVKQYVDKFSSCFILYSFSHSVGEKFDYSYLYTPELEDYIDFEKLIPYWEKLDRGSLIDVIIPGLFDYCEESSHTIPYKTEDDYRELWNRNIDTGLKKLGITQTI